MDQHLVLDPAIRDWVVLPMFFITLFVGIGRHYISQIIQSSEPADADQIRYKQTAMRAQRLRAGGNYIHEDSYQMRKFYLCEKENGLLREKVPGPPNPMSNPSAMMDMMKGNMTFMIPNMVMMAFVSYFFAGFVLVKMPFPMPSNRFKMMFQVSERTVDFLLFKFHSLSVSLTQRGVDLSTLDVSYVSSLSWYFLVNFGLRGVYRLMLGEDSDMADETKMMNMQVPVLHPFHSTLTSFQMGGMGMGGGGPQGFDASAAFKHERFASSLGSPSRITVSLCPFQ
jgi:ER membrane protein complex subunit 3